MRPLGTVSIIDEQPDDIPPFLIGPLVPLEDLEADEDHDELPCPVCCRWFRHDLLGVHLQAHFTSQAVLIPAPAGDEIGHVSTESTEGAAWTAATTTAAALAAGADDELDLLDLLDMADGGCGSSSIAAERGRAQPAVDLTSPFPQQSAVAASAAAAAAAAAAATVAGGRCQGRPKLVSRELTTEEVTVVVADSAAKAAEHVAALRVELGLPEAAEDCETSELGRGGDGDDLFVPLEAEHGGWVCPSCFFENGGKYGAAMQRHCGGCGCEPERGTWDCAICRHANAARDLKCGACEIDRPGAEGFFDPPPAAPRPLGSLEWALGGNDPEVVQYEAEESAFLVRRADASIARMRTRKAAAAVPGRGDGDGSGRVGMGGFSDVGGSPAQENGSPLCCAQAAATTPARAASSGGGDHHHHESDPDGGLIPRFRLPSFPHVQLLQMLRAEGEAMGERTSSAQREPRERERKVQDRRQSQAADSGRPLAGGDRGLAPTENERLGLPVCWSPSTEWRTLHPECTLRVLTGGGGGGGSGGGSGGSSGGGGGASASLAPASEGAAAAAAVRLMVCAPDEVEAVSEHVLDTLGARGATVHDVRRLENLGAYARYAEARRHAIASRSLEARSRTLLETVMFHGCVGLESEDAICRAGLDTACCRSGGRGHGTWLAYDAAYVDGGFAAEDASEAAVLPTAAVPTAGQGAPLRHLFVCAALAARVAHDDGSVRCVGQDCAYPMWLVRYRHADRQQQQQQQQQQGNSWPPPPSVPLPPRAPGESAAHAAGRTAGEPSERSGFGAGYYSQHRARFELKDGREWVPRPTEARRKEQEAAAAAAALSPGMMVRARGLSGRTDLNGQRGLLSCYHPAKARWAVHFVGAADAVLLRPGNLEVEWGAS